MFSVRSNERLHITLPSNGKDDNNNSSVFNPPSPQKKEN